MFTSNENILTEQNIKIALQLAQIFLANFLFDLCSFPWMREKGYENRGAIKHVANGRSKEQLLTEGTPLITKCIFFLQISRERRGRGGQIIIYADSEQAYHTWAVRTLLA